MTRTDRWMWKWRTPCIVAPRSGNAGLAGGERPARPRPGDRNAAQAIVDDVSRADVLDSGRRADDHAVPQRGVGQPLDVVWNDEVAAGEHGERLRAAEERQRAARRGAEVDRLVLAGRLHDL